MNNDNNDLLNKIQKLQNEYYNENNKNILFKNTQKFECANTISTNIDMEILLKHCIYVIPNTNKVYLEYNVLKTFVQPSNYHVCVTYFIDIIDNVVKKYGCFEAHANMTNFTVSALHRYIDLIKLFLSECLRRESGFAKVNMKTVIYNFPNSFDQLYRLLLPFIDVDIRGKMTIYTKTNSVEKLRELFL